jgi:hypothetical protein
MTTQKTPITEAQLERAARIAEARATLHARRVGLPLDSVEVIGSDERPEGMLLAKVLMKKGWTEEQACGMKTLMVADGVEQVDFFEETANRGTFSAVGWL